MIGVLGPVRISDGASPPKRDRIVLCALALDAGRVVPDERLADALWGDDVPPSWRKVVQGAIARLRRELGSGMIETSPGGYRLLATDADIDVLQFNRLVQQAGRLADDGAHDRAVDLFARALTLWRGDPLSDLEDWPRGVVEITRLREVHRLAEESMLRSRLALGEHAQVVPDAELLVAEEPLREQRWGLLALAQYRSGLQSDALRSLDKARRVLAEELGVALGVELAGLEHAILAHEPGLDPAPAPRHAASAFCPYRGLAPYDVGDQELFFGRTDEIAACRRKLSEAGVLVIVGESGSGKSSLACAGLAPVLQAEGTKVTICLPGSDPEAAVSAALAVAEARSVLLVDQAEELFAPSADPPAQQRCLAAIADCVAHRQVVIVLRADHLGSLGGRPGFASIIERGLHVLGPMDADGLRAAIEEPARYAGLRLEDGLVDLVLRDVLDQPAALPTLSHALVETWERREGHTLTVAGYRDSGGVQGAIAATAERWYVALSDGERPLARPLFLRLLSAPDEGLILRHRLPTTMLRDDPVQTRLVEALVRARLVTAREDSIEIAHEALARAWPRLRSWLDEDRAGQRVFRHLTDAAQGWDALDRDASELYRGTRLQLALEWASEHAPALTPLERSFLDAGGDRQRREEAESRRRAEQQAIANRRLSWAFVAVAILLLGSVVAGLVAVDQRSTARSIARAQAVRNLVAQSQLLRETQPDLAALLAVEAYRLAPAADTEDALFGTFTYDPGFVGFLRSDASGFADATLVEDGSTLVTLDAVDARLRRFDLASMREFQQVPATPTGGPRASLALDPDGTVAVVASATPSGTPSGALAVYELPSGNVRFAELALPFLPSDVTVSDDGRLVAVGGEGVVRIVDLQSGALVATVAVPRPSSAGEARGEDPSIGSGCRVLVLVPGSAGCRPQRAPVAIDFLGPDRLVVVADAGTIQLVDARNGAVRTTLQGQPFLADAVESVDHGGGIITAGAGGIARWDLTNGQRVWAAREMCTGMSVTEHNRVALCGRPLGGARARDLATGEEVPRRFNFHTGSATVLAAGLDGRFVVAASGSTGTIAVWRADGQGPLTTLVGSPGPAVVEYDPAGDSLLVRAGGDLDGLLPPVAVIDSSSGARVDVKGQFALGTWSGRAGILAVVFPDGTGGLSAAMDQARVEGVTVSFDSIPEHAITDAERKRMIVANGGRIRGFSTVTGEATAPRLDLPEEPLGGYGITPDGRHLVAAMPQRGVATYDIVTGALVAGPIEAEKVMAVSADGLLATATGSGVLSFRDPLSLELVGPSLTPALGPIVEVRFSSQGDRVLVFTGESVQLVNVAARRPIGDPIPVAINGDLRRDGRQLAAAGRRHVTLWDLDPAAWVRAACGVAGRNITVAEWDRYIGTLAPYRTSCTSGDPAP